MSISIHNLSKAFCLKNECKSVLNSLNLEIAQGEIFALMGQNASGKTTLLKLISSLIIPDTGEINVCGIDVRENPEQAKSRIGLIFGSEHVFYQMLSLEENLKFYGRIFGMDEDTLEDRIDDLLYCFDLCEWKDFKLSHCSSGIRQKASLVRGLLTKPDVILVDEPTKSLDAESKKTILEYLKEYVEKDNKTAIIVTHDPREAKKYANRSGILRDGRIEL